MFDHGKSWTRSDGWINSRHGNAAVTDIMSLWFTAAARTLAVHMHHERSSMRPVHVLQHPQTKWNLHKLPFHSALLFLHLYFIVKYCNFSSASVGRDMRGVSTPRWCTEGFFYPFSNLAVNHLSVCTVIRLLINPDRLLLRILHSFTGLCYATLQMGTCCIFSPRGKTSLRQHPSNIISV